MDHETGQLPGLPASPPPTVLGEVDAAFERAAELAAQGLMLHFGRDEATGRSTTELRSLSGELVRVLSPLQALEIIAGQSLDAFPPA